ncbi:hypothetical protein [Paenibacillus sp. IHBB 10380]|uniref:hypothetical protein n=1 Tax=Paenibacillus sp. IHBB 10380 TaxID=1566358 RepID=UPI0005CFBAF0|nr:hypothetical protein [Paenibacillus sp. IHBB 10380]AJS57249.1 hypothetical protein UB51_00640 [Paenibacillus sp. IHBB 10380]
MKIEKNKVNVGVGFVTGRRNFKNVVKTYVDNWNESGLVDNKKNALHLFVAYDLKYKRTKVSDYKITDEEILDMVDSAYYLGNSSITTEAQYLVEKKVITLKEANLVFGEGYAMKRNAVLYFALKNKMDYLIFLDDDEYPIANIKINDSIVWKGQEVLSTHINNIKYADMTHGHHCGYISPIPQFDFNNKLSEDEFRIFVESISNDIINWDSIKEKMNDGGVTYAELDIINSETIEVVEEVNGMKFISGANLGFNLKNLDKLFPFYNPPGARGEDTFLSTCIGECNIRKVPCYTFHDGFSKYENLLTGVLPNKLKGMRADSSVITKRFLRASIGWIRYKPLLLYITQRDHYETEIMKMKENLSKVIPKICDYFGNDEFKDILDELDFYHAHVEEHYKDFENTKSAWAKIILFLKGQ